MTPTGLLRLPVAPRPDPFAAAVLEGLSEPRKTLPARFFYDDAGSALFEAITELVEYYPTRTEIHLLEAHAPAIGRLAGPGRAVLEFGSGSSRKTPLLLAAVAPSAYVPIDISAGFLQQAARALAQAHPGIDVLPVAGDFTLPIALPRLIAGRPLLGFFPGSTIGNFSHAAAVDLLRSFRATLGEASVLVIGIDLRKDPSRLLAAYDDAAGVTARFNLNLLHRINRELDGTIAVAEFEHEARWNAPLGRIEMHLRARRAVHFMAAGRSFSMAAGETIHTENSYKYTLDESALLARAGGWMPQACWTDAEQLFSLQLWRCEPDRPQP